MFILRYIYSNNVCLISTVKCFRYIQESCPNFSVMLDIAKTWNSHRRLFRVSNRSATVAGLSDASKPWKWRIRWLFQRRYQAVLFSAGWCLFQVGHVHADHIITRMAISQLLVTITPHLVVAASAQHPATVNITTTR